MQRQKPVYAYTMTELNDNEPFDWDVDRVVKELCTPDRTWDAPAPHKLPDPERLAFQLRDLGIDGETLLTYADEYSWPTFWETLGIKKLAHHLSIGKAIKHFRERSAKYYRQKRESDLPRCPPSATPAIKPDPLNRSEPTPPPIDRSIPEPSPAAIDGHVFEPNPVEVDGAVTEASPATTGNAVTEETPAEVDRTAAEVSPAVLNDATPEPPAGLVSDPVSETAPIGTDPPAMAPTPMEGVISQHVAPIEQAQDVQMSGIPDQPPESPEKRVLDSGARQDSDEPSRDPERPLKRRRIAPTIVSAAVPAQARTFIPTEGDMFYDPLLDIPSSQTGESFRSVTLPTSTFPSDANFDRFLDAEDSKFSYLGSLALRSEDITGLPYNSEFDDDDDEDGDDRKVSEEFNWVRTAAVPPARALQVARVMRKFFRKRSPSVNEEEEVLLDFGEDDDGMSVDSETYREYEEEEKERAARESSKKSHKLGKVEVKNAVQGAIERLEVSWEKVKKPKLERRAWKIWQDARRNRTREIHITFAKNQLRSLEVRLRKIKEELLGQKWFKEDKFKVNAAGFLEESVYDRKYQTWLIELLKNPHEPPKPSTLPRLKPEPKKKRETLASDEELLTSDSEGEDQFIEDDISPVDHMDIDPKDTNPSTRPSTPDPLTNPTTEERQTNQAPEEEADTPAQLPAVNDEAEVVSKVEPTTPQRLIHTIPAEPIEILSSPADVDQLANLPPLADVDTIGKLGTEFWAKHRDGERLVLAALWSWSPLRQSEIFDAIQDRGDKEIWKEHIQPLIDRAATGISRIDVDPDSISLILALLFLTYSDFSEGRLKIKSTTLRCVTCQKLNREFSRFEEFFNFLQNCVRYFRGEPKSPIPMEMTSSEPPEANQDISMDIASDSESLASDLEELTSQPLAFAKKGRRTKHDEKAKKLRVDSKALLKQMEERRKLLRAKLAETGSLPSDKSRLIINETKESDDLPFIYINQDIGKKIKDHQIDGVRFMWDQIVVESNSRQGCLLAHTMGLGKTMQVITLLVAIAEASQSDDPRMVAQIPKDLQNGRALILCPSGLVENWADEVDMWAPGGILGEIFTIVRDERDTRTQEVKTRERILTVKQWTRSRGLLIIGYEMFRTLVSKNEDNVAELLHCSPSIVICDEAHRFKNKTSKLYAAVQNFQTMSRIATTGSPLTKNVMDYYSMINWVAPNYLSDVGEFNQKYAEPISLGLHADCSASEKKLSRERLQILKAIVAPKVNRRDIQVLVDELPQKREFILTIQMTKVQRDAYKEYLETAERNKGNDLYRTACVWEFIAALKLLLAHPKIFKSKVQERLNTNQAPAKRKKRIINDEDPDSNESDEPLDLSRDMLRSVLAKVSIRGIDDIVHSTKVIVLLQIIKECKRIGDKVLVFSQSIPTLDFLEDLFKRPGMKILHKRLDGSTPVGKRQAAIKDFNTDNSLDVYLISTKAGGVGLNIPGANRVVLFDFGFTPAEEQQAVGRAYRIGQKKDVFVYHLKVGGTYETAIHNVAVFKRQLAERVVDKKKPIPSSTRVREYFIAPPENLPQKDLSTVKGLDPDVLDNILASAECSNVIREIHSTETFEREEVYEFTPEEHQELNKQIELEELRINNPEEYKRRMFPSPETSLPALRPHLGTPILAGGESPSALLKHAQQDTNQRRQLIRILVPLHLRDNRNPTTSIPPSTANNIPASTQAGTPISGIAPTVAASPALVSSPSPADGQAAALGPILGINTHYKVAAEPPRKPDTLKAPEIIPKPRRPEDTTPKLLEALDEVHRKLRDEGYDTSIHPQDLVMQLNSECDRQDMAPGTLPRMDKLRSLCRSVTESSRFGEALLTGYLTPNEVVAMSMAQMKAKIAEYQALTDDLFKREIWAHQRASVRTTPPPPPAVHRPASSGRRRSQQHN